MEFNSGFKGLMARLVRCVVNLTAERGVTRLQNGPGYIRTGQDRRGQEPCHKPTAGLATVAKKTLQATQVQCSNTEVCSSNHWWRGKTNSSTYSESMSVILFIQDAQRLAFAILHSHLWPVRPYRIFPHYLTNGTIFGCGGGVWGRLLNIKCVS